jgi:hypothetical protein
MKKDLLTDFNLRDGSDKAISVISREVDTFFAWSFLCSQAAQLLGVYLSALDADVSNHLRRIVYEFPDSLDDEFDPTLLSWAVPETWTNAASLLQWRKLLSDDGFNRLLRTFTFSYILLAELPAGPHVQIIRWSQQQRIQESKFTFADRLGITAPQFPIGAPSVGWGKSYHLQVALPDDIVLTDAVLARPLGPISWSSDEYDLRRGEGVVQMHSTDALRPDDYVFAVEVRVPVAGYLRATWLAAVFSTLILWIGWWFLARHEPSSVSETSEPAITLLLVAPSLITAYLVRPGEHAITARLLRNLRIAAGVAGLCSYVAAGILVLGMQGPSLNHAWATVAAVSTVGSALLSVAIYRSYYDTSRASQLTGTTYRAPVWEIDYA